MTETISAWSFLNKRRMSFDIVAREAIGTELRGPAIVTEATSTLYVDDGWVVSNGGHGELVLKRKV